jgi:hypothetical protein
MDITASAMLDVLLARGGTPGAAWIDPDALREDLAIYIPRALQEALTMLRHDGFVAAKVVRPSDVHIVITPTPKGLASWSRRRRARGEDPILPARQPRADQRLHHVLTIEAALEWIAAHHARFVRLDGDADLRSELFAGKRKRRKKTFPPVPDGRATWLDENGVEQTTVIEILTSGYTTDMLIEKSHKLPRKTRFFTTSPPVQRRAREARIRDVWLLDGKLLRLPKPNVP